MARALYHRSSRLSPRPGYAIVAVLIVIVVLSLAAYRFGDYMMGEYRAVTRIQQAAEARGLADSGIYYCTAMLASPTAYMSNLNSNPYDNSSVFLGQTVAPAAAGKRQGYFTLAGLDYSVTDNNGQPTLRYGVVDECGKINLNSLYQLDTGGAASKAALTTANTNTGATDSTQTTNATGSTTTQGTILYNALMNLPNMTSSIANAILDWIDVDENARDGGAESSYYLGLSPAYRCKNAPLSSVEELLFVQGVTPQLLFGTDRNRNGINDENAQSFDPGWLPYLTVYSREANMSSPGTPKLYVNGGSLSTLYTNLTGTTTGQAGLSSDLASFIIAYQLYTPVATLPMGKVTTGQSSDLTTAVQTALGASTAPTAKQKIPSLYALIGSYVLVPGSQGQPDTYYPSPIMTVTDAQTYFPTLQTQCSTSQQTYLPGRINVNTASEYALLAIPGFTSTDVQNILTSRPTLDALATADPVFQSTIWLYTLANITPAKLQVAESFITASTYIYRVQSVGYFDQSGPQVRVEAIVDTSQSTPAIMYYRDLTELGRAFNFNQ